MIIENLIHEESRSKGEAKNYFVEYIFSGNRFNNSIGFTHGTVEELISDIVKDIKVSKAQYNMELLSCKINGCIVPDTEVSILKEIAFER